MRQAKFLHIAGNKLQSVRNPLKIRCFVLTVLVFVAFQLWYNFINNVMYTFNSNRFSLFLHFSSVCTHFPGLLLNRDR